MSAPTAVAELVVLHGRRNNESDGAWLHGLTCALNHSGRRLAVAHQTLDYLDLLDRNDAPRRSALPRPAVVSDSPSRDYAARAQRLRNALELSRSPARRRGVPMPRSGPAVEQAIKLRMKDVHRYRGDPHRKDAILRHLLRQLPDEGRIVLVGHSLGSVVALDLIRVLPPAVRVDLLVTTGSPLALQMLADQVLGATYGFPEGAVDVWLNVYDPRDVVTAGRPLSPVMPHAVDAAVNNGDDRHKLARYLAQPVVADVLHHVGIAAARAASRATRVNGKDEEMSSAAASEEQLPADLVGRLVALQYASHVEANLPVGERRARHYQARLKVRDNVDEALKEAGWDVDPSGDLAPLMRGRHSRSEAVGVLVELATSNPLSPFEVEIPREIRRDALEALAKDLRLPKDGWGAVVLDAVEAAKRAHGRRPWSPILLGAAGLGLLVAGPIAVGLLGAAFGGAAAITAGLAALGPGGMAGGLWLVGLSAGTGGVALRSALAAMSPEQLQIEVLRLQSTGLVQKQRGVPKRGRDEDKTLRALLKAAETEADEHEKIDDQKSQTYKAVIAKRDMLRRAVEWADKHLAESA